MKTATELTLIHLAKRIRTLVRSLVAAASLLALSGCSGTADPEVRKAVETVIARGGKVNVHGTAVPVRSTDKIPATAFEVDRVDLQGSKITLADLEQLKPLKSLKTLVLQETPLVDKWTPSLAGFTQLTELNLYGTRVTDAGLEPLAGLARLQKLDLSYTNIKGKGLAQLAALKELKQLFLYGTTISPDALAKLKTDRPDLEILR